MQRVLFSFSLILKLVWIILAMNYAFENSSIEFNNEHFFVPFQFHFLNDYTMINQLNQVLS